MVVPAGALFTDFERIQGQKREELSPLRELLERDLELVCDTCGRDEIAEVAKADIIFLDLFLGFFDDEEAIQRAIRRVQGVVAQRRDNPPSVVLLSANPLFSEVGPRLRDDAELLGCQFRMVRKKDLVDAETMIERLYELATSYPDALKLNAFLQSWNRALEDARKRFLRSIRTLDLADYANMQALILEAEGEPVGDYILDLYDLHLHNVLEGDGGLVQAAKTLNQIDWKDYPSAQFMPSAEAIGMMDGSMFHHQMRTKVEGQIEANPRAVRLGDVFLSPPPAPAGTAQAHPPDGSSRRRAYVVLSQACDLQHGAIDQILLLRGTVQPYGWAQQSNKSPSLRTPVMFVGDDRFAIDWDVLGPETWTLDELVAKIEGGYKRVRRFRTPFALQLQQAFIGRLGRVGTLAALPSPHAVGVRVFLRDSGNSAVLLAEAAADGGEAVCLIGRNEKNNPIEWLLLSEKLQGDMRRALRGVDPATLPGGALSVLAIRDDPGFYRKLKGGLLMSRDSAKGAKPFRDTAYDIVQIIARPILQPGEKVDRSLHPLIFEVDVP